MKHIAKHPELTIERLKEMEPDKVFARGFVLDHETVCNITGRNTGKMLKWVAVRGGIHDWAIYCEDPENPMQRFGEVARLGNKIHSDDIIRELQPCTDEAFKMYRR